MPEPTSTPAGVELSVIIPTFNERENAPLVVDALHAALDGVVEWEAIFVDDDSPDGTAEAVKAIGRTDPRVRCLHRIGRRGLSSACIEGVLASGAPWAAVMDADLQHEEAALPRMLERLRAGGLDIAVGSRYVAGGGVGDWSQGRLRMSQAATRLARLVTRADLSDPMSGFFMVRRSTFNQLTPKLSGIGFKLLLDLFASASPPLRHHEEPYTFRLRQHGESKLDSHVVWDFVMMLADKRIGKYVPVRFISFAFVGGLGVVLHVSVFYSVFALAHQSFVVSKVVAVLTSIAANFSLNNALTYRDRRLKGWSWVIGLLSFALVCSVGAAADIGISSYIYNSAPIQSFWRTFSIVPVIAGVLVGAVWNYAVSSAYTWRKSDTQISS